jgi:hypothetical protein
LRTVLAEAPNEGAGYDHPAYPASLSGFGRPQRLPRSGGWILVRDIPGTDLQDGLGPYPLFACPDWAGLPADLGSLPGLVSLALVPDPFGGHDEALLRSCFDRVRPFKDHYVIDLSADRIGSGHHRARARKALAAVTVEHCPEPGAVASQWVELYAELIRRHRLRGIKAFSPQALTDQLDVPGTILFRARVGDRPVGMFVLYARGEVAYHHLSAQNAEGYELGASYALHARAIDWLRGRARWLDLGAGAGVTADPTDGLSRFKRGWATGTRTAYFCGRVFDPDRYAALVRRSGCPPTDYFPAYRAGELA